MNVRKRSPDKLMAKAQGFCAAARLLLEAGHIDDAATRAYYAMFDAARAALLASGAPIMCVHTKDSSARLVNIL